VWSFSFSLKAFGEVTPSIFGIFKRVEYKIEPPGDRSRWCPTIDAPIYVKMKESTAECNCTNKRDIRSAPCKIPSTFQELLVNSAI